MNAAQNIEKTRSVSIFENQAKAMRAALQSVKPSEGRFRANFQELAERAIASHRMPITCAF